jgi:hypothetical protein
MDALKSRLLGALINILIGMLTPELVRQLADQVLGFAEKAVLGTASSVDDAIILPILEQIRIAFGIPKVE